MALKDRLTAGLLAGFLSGIAGILFELFLAGLLGLGELSFLNFSGGMLFFHTPRNPAEQFVATLVHLLFSAFVGGAFAYFLVLTSHRNDLLKGAIFDIAVTWVIWAVTYLYRMRPENPTPINVIENDISAAFEGMAMALFYRIFRPREPAGSGGTADEPVP